MVEVFPVRLDSDTQTFYKLGFAWQQPAQTNVRGFDSSGRWALTYKNYEQYAVTGMKLKWIPGNIRGAVAPDANQSVGGFIGPMFVYSDIDTLDTTGYIQDQIVGLDSNRVMSPYRTWKKYYGCKSISKQ